MDALGPVACLIGIGGAGISAAAAYAQDGGDCTVDFSGVGFHNDEP